MNTTIKIIKSILKQPRRLDFPVMLKALNCKYICEVGVNRGDNFRLLLNAEPDLAVAVDAWRADGAISQNDNLETQETLNTYHDDLVTLSKTVPAIKILRMYSLEAAKTFADEFFDFVYIDADHTYEAVKQDISAWYPKVKRGGVLSGHDYSNWTNSNGVRFGVIEAVNEFVEKQNLKDNFHTTKGHCKNWLVVKP